MGQEVTRYCNCGRRLYSTKSQEAGKCYKCDKRTGYSQNKQGLSPRIKMYLSEDRRQRVLKHIRSKGELTVQELVACLDEEVSHQSVYRDLSALRERGLVDKRVGTHPSGSGRASLWCVQDSS